MAGTVKPVTRSVEMVIADENKPETSRPRLEAVILKALSGRDSLFEKQIADQDRRMVLNDVGLGVQGKDVSH